MVDDEKAAIDYFTQTMERLQVEGDVACFQRTSEALQFVGQNQVDVAFLDVEMPGDVSGIDLTLKLREINPDVVVVFVTGHPDYALDAFGVDANGYILKPYNDGDIQKELLKSKRIRGASLKNRIYIKTFGGFDVYVDDKPLHFQRSKAKELLALLVDRRGSSMTSAKIATYLWEEREYDGKVKEYLNKCCQSLKATLQEARAESILIESYNSRSINMLHLTCDYYRFLNGEKEAVNQYRGDYMEDYSWAEETNGELYQMKLDEKD